jgi:serine/threonine protein kinase
MPDPRPVDAALERRALNGELSGEEFERVLAFWESTGHSAPRIEGSPDPFVEGLRSGAALVDEIEVEARSLEGLIEAALELTRHYRVDDTRSGMTGADSSVAGHAVGPGVAEVARTGRDPDLATPTLLELSPGTDLGAYRIVRKLGQGGMGFVFLAEHRRMERLVALKVLPPSATGGPGEVERFHREVKSLAKLAHPNIVAAHDADETRGLHFLVMEYVDGPDLAALVRTQGPLPVAQAVDFIQQAARGLEYAHAQGVIHRDVKPSNLLVDAAGRVKVLDLGLARWTDTADATGRELTALGSVLGTIDYMAPEQASDTRAADARADVYSLGCTLFYLLTGRSPYRGDTALGRILAHEKQPIPSLRAVRADVPVELDGVLRRMLGKTPGERYASMTELLAHLERVGASPAKPGATVRVLPYAAAGMLLLAGTLVVLWPKGTGLNGNGMQNSGTLTVPTAAASTEPVATTNGATEPPPKSVASVTPTTAPPASSANPSTDPQVRAYLRDLIDRGCKVDVETPGSRLVQIFAGQPFPETPFQFIAVDVHSNGEVSDDDLKRLATIPTIRRLHIHFQRQLTDAGFAALTGLPDLQELNLHGNRVGRGTVEILARMPRLERLILFDTPIGDAEIEPLGTAPRLRSVHLRNSTVSIAGLRKIASSRIDELTLDNTALRYEELEQLAELFPNLAILLLRSPLKGNRSLGLSGLSNLTKLHQLTPAIEDLADADLSSSSVESLELTYQSTPFSPAIARRVVTMPRLTRLILGASITIEPEALAEVARSRTLTQITFFLVPATAESTEPLIELRTLKSLLLQGTGVPSEVVEKFRAARPDVEVRVDG